MSEVKEEYTRENYPSFGKKYNDEKAIISLTSWKARINTVSKTLFSLIQQCPGFHIVLVLSEEEFPKMCEELPENLMLFVENEMIELLWVYKNYKSFKKVLFTMDKYRDVPVISADDDCIYTCNYAQELYDKWKDNKDSIILYRNTGNKHLQGTNTLYPSNCFPMHKTLLKKLFNFQKKSNSDDTFFSNIANHIHINFIHLHNNHLPFYFHDEINPIHPEYKKQSYFKNCYL